MSDIPVEHGAQLQSTKRRKHSALDEAKWLYGYGPYRYYTPAQDQIRIQFALGNISGILTTGGDTQSEDFDVHQVPLISKEIHYFVRDLVRQYIKQQSSIHALALEARESFTDEEPEQSVPVEGQVGDRAIDAATDDVLQWTSDNLYSAILDVDSESDMPRLRDMVLVAEDTGFAVAQDEQLAPWLLNFAERYRDSSDPQDEAAVWSAIRTGASMLTPHDVDNLRALLEPGHSIETSLVTVKMIGRIFEAQPPADVDEHTDLADEVFQIAESLLNRYTITLSQSAAMAQLAIYALAAMASSKTQQIVETIQQLSVTWFTQRTLRKLRELRNAWERPHSHGAGRPLELLDKAIQFLA